LPTIETTYHGFPVRLALITDLHNQPYENIIKSLRSHRPEIIAVAGDVMLGSISELTSQINVLPFLRACAALAPTYFSLGNHEKHLTAADLHLIEETGTVVLDNAWREIDVHGMSVVIGGLTSGYVMRRRNENPTGTEKNQPIPDTSWLPNFMMQSGYHILLSHHPEYYSLIPEGVLILSGHAHGGQWRFYDSYKHVWRGVFAPRQGLFPQWTKGVYAGRMVVSAGLSNTTWIPRINNPTEIVYIEP
jgi:uncharacterized protein